MAGVGQIGALAAYLEEHAVTLVCLNGEEKGNPFKIERDRIILGSSRIAEFPLEGRGVAPEHAAIEVWAGSFVLREIHPARPIALNGTLCRCRELRDGDRFTLGDLRFEFHCERL